jgi:hypothetical protein
MLKHRRSVSSSPPIRQQLAKACGEPVRSALIIHEKVTKKG